MEQMVQLLNRRGEEYAALEEVDRARAVAAHIVALRAYQALARGGLAELAAMDTALREIPWLSMISPEATLRYMVGKLLLERGNLSDAQRYFRSFGPIDLIATQVEFHLGRIAELQGRGDEAAGHYRLFIAWWQDADPALQGPVEEARAGLRRLGVSSP